MSTRVAVTGVGVVCASGQSREAFWESLVAGKTSIGSIELFETLWTSSKIAGEVKGFRAGNLTDADKTRYPVRSAQFAIVAAAEALSQSGLCLADYDPYRVGIVMGTCQGTLPELDPEGIAYPPLDFMYASCDAVAHFFGLKGPRLVVSNACAAGTNAIGLARDKLWAETDLMLAGGSDALTFFSMAGFSSLQSLDVEPCSPYGRSRGLTLGEGAAIIILEPLHRALERGAPVLAELRGYGLSADAYHPTAPDPSGRGAALAMRRALAQAQLDPGSVDYVNGHGTGTQANDLMERLAFRKVFGIQASKVPVSSTKSMIGHTLGAAGAIEAAACVLAIEHNILPPTANFPDGTLEDDFDFVPNRGRPARVDVVLSNNYAFGGSNASLVLSRPSALTSNQSEPDTTFGVSVTGIGTVGSLGIGLGAWWNALAGGETGIRPLDMGVSMGRRCLAATSSPLPSRGFASAGDWRRMDRFERMCVASARLAWNDAKVDVGQAEAENIAVLLATANGSLETMAAFDRSARSAGDEVNPGLFPHTALNAAAGHVSTTLGFRGPTSTITSGGVSGLSALVYAADLIGRGEATIALVVAADQFCKPLLAMIEPWDELLASDMVRPFDERASGTAPGEAAVTLVLERSDNVQRDGRRSYGKVLGHGHTSDTESLGGMSGSGQEWAEAIRQALKRSSVDCGDVTYCAAAASGIQWADLAEAIALGSVFDSRLRVGAPKSLTGECLAASGMINVVACLLALNDGKLTPTSGLERPLGVGKLLHLSAPVSEAPANYCLANSAAFGGNYVSVMLGRG